MGKPSGFLEYPRHDAEHQEIKERLKHYREFTTHLNPREIAIQGARCMDCGIPFCHSFAGCPVVNLIPEWNDLVYHDLWPQAYERLELTNNFPEITGRICPAPCETACTLALNDNPVSIKQIELAIIEKAFEQGWVVPRPPQQESGKSVAIVGSGPAGLAAAQQLRRLGHQVTVFEKSPKIGGLLRYGIPDFKLEKWILDRRLEQMKAEGVEFNTDVHIGDDLSARYLQKSFNVILIAVGAAQPRELDLPGCGLKGIYFAMDYLTRSNKYNDGMIGKDKLISARDKNVLVLGGGDTGSDCVGTANRQGAKQVYQFEILPKPREWDKPWNPDWPNWPAILQTSSSQEEGCNRDWGILIKKFDGERGKLKRATFSRLEWQMTDSNDRPVMKEINNSEFTLDVDLVLLAMGYAHVEHDQLQQDLGLEYNKQANISIDSKYQTSVKGVFAAGDAHTGASLVVRAIFHGRQAAKAIDDYLR
jgi:glutamate synthase (NADPH/NADH) small chain